MRRDIVVARELGADGIVIGGLRPDGSVDVALVRMLVEAAPTWRHLPSRIRLHTRFEASLESLADNGVQRVLTRVARLLLRSGVATLADLVRRAGSRLVVMAGGVSARTMCASWYRCRGFERFTCASLDCQMAEEPRLVVSSACEKPLPMDEAAWEETDEQRVRSFVSTTGRLAETRVWFDRCMT